MSLHQTEREWLEGLRYEDKFPDVCSRCHGDGVREQGTTQDSFGNWDTVQVPCECQQIDQVAAESNEGST